RCDDGAISPYNERRFLVCQLRESTGLAQIPVGTPPWAIADSCGVEDLTVHQDVAGLLWNDENVPRAQYHIGSRVLPFRDGILNVDHYTANGWIRAQLLKRGMSLSERVQLGAFLLRVVFRQELQIHLFGFHPVYEFVVSFFLSFANFPAHQHGAVWI